MKAHRLINLLLRAVGGVRRRPWLHLLSLVTLTAAFLSFAATLTAAVNLDKMIDNWIGSAEITVFLFEGTTDNDLEELSEAVAKTSGVARVDPISSTEAMARFEKDMGDIAKTLPERIFPPSLDVHLDSKISRDPDARAALAARLEQVDVVEKVELYDDWYAKLSALSLVGRLAAWGLGFIAFTVAILVVTALVRTGVNARKREIEVLELVGATRSYVNSPFLLEGAMEALLAMVLALIGLHFISNAAADFTGDFIPLMGSDGLARLAPMTSIYLLIGSMVLGLIGARFSLRGLRREA